MKTCKIDYLKFKVVETKMQRKPKLTKVIRGRVPFQQHFSYIETSESCVSGFGHSRGQNKPIK